MEDAILQLRSQFTHDIKIELERYIANPEVVKIKDVYEVAEDRFYIDVIFEINRNRYYCHIPEEVYSLGANVRVWFCGREVKIGMRNVISELNRQIASKLKIIFWSEGISCLFGKEFFEEEEE